jgi:DNA repair and recombination protein RAD52
MGFDAGQREALASPLNKAHVKAPAPGKYGEYIEGWRVIDEANRIFGFDGWTRETAEMIETNRSQQGDKWFVGFMARARVTAGGIFRDGTGFGSGVSKNLGDAIESAVKEAETDAMKRALMTFGNPFGLALYDKSKANVADVEPETPKPIADLLSKVENAETVLVLQRLWKEEGAKVFDANGPFSETVNQAFIARRSVIDAMDRMSA